MSSFKLSMNVRGVREFTQGVKLTNDRMRQRAAGIIRRGTERIAGTAKQLVPKRSGELASTIRAEFSDDGMVGWARAGYGKLVRRNAKQAQKDRFRKRNKFRKKFKGSAAALKALDLGVYAPVVEYGDKRRRRKPREYMKRAFRTNAHTIQSEFERLPRDAARDGGLA